MAQKFGDRVAAGPKPVAPASVEQPIRRTVEVVTYLHGGGPSSGDNDHPQRPTRRPDALTPIRGSTARGQLRFWWRATHGCSFATVKELRKHEDDLWGNASTPGRVDLRIDQRGLAANNVETEKLGGVGTGLRYGAFASANLTQLRGSAVVELRLRDASNEQRRQVEDALTAWLLFGGIGGRTRRGFGALTSQGLPDPKAFIAGLGGGPCLARVPTLRGATVEVSKRAFPNSVEAHRAAVDALRRFRQEPNLGRNPGQQANRPGRSRWPEPDEIRRLTGQGAAAHRPEHPVHAFPRGAFGMPIVFHFMGHGEPNETQLVPDADTDRMASPVVLRPTGAGTQWRAMALRLVVPDLRLTAALSRARRRDPVPVSLTAQQAGQIRPLADRGGSPDVIATFLNYFASSLA